VENFVIEDDNLSAAPRNAQIVIRHAEAKDADCKDASLSAKPPTLMGTARPQT